MLMTTWVIKPIGPKPIGPTAHWSVTHWSDDKLVQKSVIRPKTFGPKKCAVGPTAHWSEKLSLVRKPIGLTTHWPAIGPKMAGQVQIVVFARSLSFFSRAVYMLVTGKTDKLSTNNRFWQHIWRLIRKCRRATAFLFFSFCRPIFVFPTIFPFCWLIGKMKISRQNKQKPAVGFLRFCIMRHMCCQNL